jgi:hypothetical protein
MDTHPDDLSDLERRLAAWQPAAQGLDADAMLFAAGRAAGRPPRGRLLWAALSVSLAVLAVALGAWAARERSGRLALAQQLRQPAAPAPGPLPPAAVPSEEPAESPSTDSLLAARRALEHGLDAWPPRPVVSSDPSPPSAPVLRLGGRNSLLGP